MFKDNLLSIKNNESSWIAITLAIPTYLIVLIGTTPILQGCFYLMYLIGLYFIWSRRQERQFTTSFILTSIIFLLLWVVPNIVTKTSGRLESDMLSMPILIYHVIILSAVLAWARSWIIRQKQPHQAWEACCQTLWVCLSPLVILILIESLRLKFEFPAQRPEPFSYRHLIGEVVLMFILMAIALPSRWLKVTSLIISILILHLIENRGGLLSMGVVIGLLLTVKLFQQLGWKKCLVLAILVIGSAYIFFVQIYNLIDYFFLLEHQSRGLGSGFTHRLPVWIDTWHEIQRVPWTGVGFWVSPYPYWQFNQIEHAVHNIFLRILVENGAPLFIFIVALLGLTAIQIERKKLPLHRMAFWGILIYYFFIPRHLTLNPLSFLLYWTIIQALSLPLKNKKTTEN
jgi:O-antigen ligase